MLLITLWAVFFGGCMAVPPKSEEGTKAVSAAFNYYLEDRMWTAIAPVVVYINADAVSWEELVSAYPGKSVGVTFKSGRSIEPREGVVSGKGTAIRSEVINLKVRSLTQTEAVVSISWIAGDTGAEGHVYELKKKNGRWEVTKELARGAG